MWNYSFVFTRFFRKCELDTTNTGAGGLFVNEKEYSDWRKNMKNEEYKKMSIKEFTKAAGRYESNHAGNYDMC